jgi:hypothetical protein
MVLRAVLTMLVVLGLVAGCADSAGMTTADAIAAVDLGGPNDLGGDRGEASVADDGAAAGPGVLSDVRATVVGSRASHGPPAPICVKPFGPVRRSMSPMGSTRVPPTLRRRSTPAALPSLALRADGRPASARPATFRRHRPPIALWSPEDRFDTVAP